MATKRKRENKEMTAHDYKETNWKEIKDFVELDFDNGYKAAPPNGEAKFFWNEYDANLYVAECLIDAA